MQTNIIRQPVAALFALAIAAPQLFAAELPPMPQPATSFGAAIADGALYTYGGNTGRAHEFHTECINGDFFRLKMPDGTAWEKLPGGEPLLGAPLAAHGGFIYRVGGMEARNKKGEKDDLHSTSHVVRFNIKANKWEKLPELPQPRSSHDIAVFGDTLYVGGGWKLKSGNAEGDGGEWHDTLLSMDLKAPEKGWKSVPQSFKRRALAVVVLGDRIWFLGGMENDDDPSRRVDWFEPKTGAWGKGPLLPDGSLGGFGMASCVGKGKLIASPITGKIYALSADQQSWEEISKLQKPRFFHRLLPLADGRLVAAGGSSRKGQIPELELVDLDAKPVVEATTQTATSTAAGDVKAPSEPNGGAPWSQWRGANRDGISAEVGWRKDWPAEGPRKLWTAKVGEGMSSSVVVDGRLFTQGNDGKDQEFIYALDAATGAELWKSSFPCRTSAHEMPIVPNGPGATPTIASGHLYTLTREGDLVCIEANTGRLAWKKNLVADLGGKRPVYGYAQSPLVENNTVFVDVGAAPEGKTSTVALDASTGDVRWRAGTGEAGYSSARSFSRDGLRYIAMFKGEALDVFAPADGRVVWSFRTTARDFTNSATPVFVGHRILVSNTSADESAALLDWDTGATPNVRAVWKHKQFALLFNTAIEYDGSLFAFNEKRRGHHEFTCVDSATGETRWVSDKVPTSTFILADNHWLFLTRDGEVVVAPASSKELNPGARFKAVDGKCYATPTLANGRLYVRTNTGDLAAFDLRPTAQAQR